MENFKELQQLINEKSHIETQITHAKTIGLWGQYSTPSIVAVKNNDNGRYDFGSIQKIIGEEKLKSIVAQFAGLVHLELVKAKEQKEAELAQFSVVKQPTNEA